MTNNDKVYEVKMRFNPDELNEAELKQKLNENFEEDYVQKNGYEVTALFYVEHDAYTDAEDDLNIQIATILAGGQYGSLVSYQEVEAE